MSRSKLLHCALFRNYDYYKTAGEEMHVFKSITLDEFLYLLMEKHRGSCYLRNCEMKFQSIVFLLMYLF
jgi:hypothetical protein